MLMCGTQAPKSDRESLEKAPACFQTLATLAGNLRNRQPRPCSRASSPPPLHFPVVVSPLKKRYTNDEREIPSHTPVWEFVVWPGCESHPDWIWMGGVP